MTNQEVLQKFGEAVNVQQLKADFPDIQWVISKLDDGQQEIIIRLQGEDADFYPAADYAAIDAMTQDDNPRPVKSSLSLLKEKSARRYARKKLLHLALFKRIKTLLNSAGIPLEKFVKLINECLPVEDEE